MLTSAKNSVEKNEDFKKYGLKLGRLNANDRKLVLDGAEIFKSFCSACHGGDGKGLPTNAAPPLLGASHLTGDKETAIRILLHGLKGPIDGKNYSAEMPSMKDNSDEWIASVLSYSRYEFTVFRPPTPRPANAQGNPPPPMNRNQSPAIQPSEVKKLRELHLAVNSAWSIDELEKINAQK
jgi:mono/diheme cytochrome c family protein